MEVNIWVGLLVIVGERYVIAEILLSRASLAPSSHRLVGLSVIPCASNGEQEENRKSRQVRHDQNDKVRRDKV